MFKSVKAKSFLMLTAGVLVGLLLGLAGATGYFFGQRASQDLVTIPEIPLQANAAQGGNGLILATGQLAEGQDAICTLDKLTGVLSVWAINPRVGQVTARYTYNVAGDMQVEQGKKPDYVMVTGDAAFRGGGAANNYAGMIIYVGEGGSGNVAAYLVPWNSQGGFRAPQGGTLQRAALEKARLVQLEETE